MHEQGARKNISRAPAGRACHTLWLFVAGEEANSRQARENLMRLCERCLMGRCEVVLYDVLKDFQSALDHRVLVTPTLIRVWPLPRLTILGNLNDATKVMAALWSDGGER